MPTANQQLFKASFQLFLWHFYAKSSCCSVFPSALLWSRRRNLMALERECTCITGHTHIHTLSRTRLVLCVFTHPNTQRVCHLSNFSNIPRGKQAARLSPAAAHSWSRHSDSAVSPPPPLSPPGRLIARVFLHLSDGVTQQSGSRGHNFSAGAERRGSSPVR